MKEDSLQGAAVGKTKILPPSNQGPVGEIHEDLLDDLQDYRKGAKAVKILTEQNQSQRNLASIGWPSLWLFVTPLQNNL